MLRGDERSWVSRKGPRITCADFLPPTPREEEHKSANFKPWIGKPKKRSTFVDKVERLRTSKREPVETVKQLAEGKLKQQMNLLREQTPAVIDISGEDMCEFERTMALEFMVRSSPNAPALDTLKFGWCNMGCQAACALAVLLRQEKPPQPKPKRAGPERVSVGYQRTRTGTTAVQTWRPEPKMQITTLDLSFNCLAVLNDHISLHDNSKVLFTDDQWKARVKALPQSLDGFVELLEAMRCQPALTSLDLSNNEIGESYQGLDGIWEGEGQGIAALVRLFDADSPCQLAHFNFAENHLRSHSLAQLARAWARQDALRTVDLTSNHVASAPLVGRMNMLNDYTGLEELCHSMVCRVRDSEDAQGEIEAELGAIEREYMVRVNAMKATMTECDMQMRQLLQRQRQVGETKAIKDGVAKVQGTIAEQKDWLVGAKAVHFEHKRQVDDRLQRATERLAEVTHLRLGIRTLDLANNLIGDAGAALLARALEKNLSLERLGLRQNYITAAGAGLLGDALLKHNRTLTALDLRGNFLMKDVHPMPKGDALGFKRKGDAGPQPNKTGLEALLAAVEANRSVVELDLRENDMTRECGLLMLECSRIKPRPVRQTTGVNDGEGEEGGGGHGHGHHGHRHHHSHGHGHHHGHSGHSGALVAAEQAEPLLLLCCGIPQVAMRHGVAEVVRLELVRSGITVADLMVLSQHVKMCPCIRLLDLSENALTGITGTSNVGYKKKARANFAGIRALHEAMGESKSLRSVNLTQVALVGVDWRGNGTYEAAGLNLIAKALCMEGCQVGHVTLSKNTVNHTDQMAVYGALHAAGRTTAMNFAGPFHPTLEEEIRRKQGAQGGAAAAAGSGSGSGWADTGPRGAAAASRSLAPWTPLPAGAGAEAAAAAAKVVLPPLEPTVTFRPPSHKHTHRRTARHDI
jgi:hypothetical protein